MLADALTRPNKTQDRRRIDESNTLGQLANQIPGGTKIASPQQLFSSTWAQIVRGQTEDFHKIATWESISSYQETDQGESKRYESTVMSRIYIKCDKKYHYLYIEIEFEKV